MTPRQKLLTPRSTGASSRRASRTVCPEKANSAKACMTSPACGRDVFTFERIHQMARDARARGHNRVVLPYGEFSDAMQTFYAVTKGKRARDKIDEQRFSF